MPPFSVLMSVYKNEKAEHLRQALDSVIEQTLPPAEIVLVKDGPLTEELDQCVDSFCCAHRGLFKIVEFAQNRGLGLALRDGLLACTCAYVARMDSDDIAKPDRFEKQINYLLKNADIALLGSWIKEFSTDPDKPDSCTNLPCTDAEIRKYAKRRNPFRHMTVMFKKSAVLDSGSYRDFLWFEDYDLWIRVLRQGHKCANMPEYLVDVRAGKSMFERRGGGCYLKQDIKFQVFLLKIAYISPFEFLTNVLIRTTIRLMPNSLRVLFYRLCLRKR